MIFNHYAAKLSDLDMQIVNCVPPGGELERYSGNNSFTKTGTNTGEL